MEGYQSLHSTFLVMSYMPHCERPMPIWIYSLHNRMPPLSSAFRPYLRVFLFRSFFVSIFANTLQILGGNHNIPSHREWFTRLLVHQSQDTRHMAKPLVLGEILFWYDEREGVREGIIPLTYLSKTKWSRSVRNCTSTILRAR